MTMLDDGQSRRGMPVLRGMRGRLIAVFAISLALIAGSVTPAHATYYDGGLVTRGFGVTYQSGLNSTYTGAFTHARTAWNNAGVGAEISSNTLNVKKMQAGSYSASWYGLYTPTGGRNSTRNFTIQVNSRTISADAGSNGVNYIKSTSTHELGHALSLADNPPVTVNQSLMRYDRSRATLITPTAYDTSEVRRIYG